MSVLLYDNQSRVHLQFAWFHPISLLSYSSVVSFAATIVFSNETPSSEAGGGRLIADCSARGLIEVSCGVASC